MSRMDRYSDLEIDNKEEEKLSRAEKNREMYEDVYLNASVVDIDNYLDQEEHEEENPEPMEEKTEIKEEVYEQKNYNINDYLEKAHEKQVNDQALRDLNSKDFQTMEDEISKFIADIEAKNSDLDFLEELKGDNEDTMVKGQMKTDEFNQDIYNTLAEEEIFSNTSITSLSKALGDNTVFDLEKDQDEKLEHTFEKIVQNDQIMARKIKKLPIIVFAITLVLLIIVIILIIIMN